jgi:hypothetical protein
VEELAWTAWPARRSPVRAAVAVAVMGLIGWTLESVFRAPFFTALGVLLVWSQIAGFFLPTRYALTEDGVTVAGLVGRKQKAWSEFRSCLVDREGVLLSPFAGRSRLERFRGLSLQFHGNRDEVMAFVERRIPRPEDGDAHVGDAGHAGGDRARGA